MTLNFYIVVFKHVCAKQIITSDTGPQAPGQESTERFMCKNLTPRKVFSRGQGLASSSPLESWALISTVLGEILQRTQTAVAIA